MTINTIKNILTVVTDETAIAELTAELERLEKAQAERARKSAAKAATSAEAREVVLATTEKGVAMTASEIWEACEGLFADSFTKGNLTYALSRVWIDSFEKDTTGKVNTYTRV